MGLRFKMRLGKRFTEYLDRSMKRSLSHSVHQLVGYGALAFFCFPVLYFTLLSPFPQAFEHLALRSIGGLLGLGLVLTPYWPAGLKPYLSWYWFFTLVFILPFFSTYLFLMSQATVISSLFLLCSIFLLVLLLDLFSLIVVLLLGCSFAFIAYYLSVPYVFFGEVHLEMTLIVILTIIAGSTLNYKTAILQQQRLAGMAAAAGMIAHELRTPLLGIKSGSQALIQYLPGLIQGYQLAKEKGLIEQPFRDRRLYQLNGVSERVVREIDYANTIIEMLLVKAGQENFMKNCIFETCSISECVNEGVSRYPFESAKERRIMMNIIDFEFMGSNLLMQHVLFNLIKNALYVIATVARGEIFLWTECKEKYNYLYFKDTASGMSKHQLNQLFNHFYTTTFMGTGIGLSFCKLVMTGLGGNISCESVEGEYTLFTLSFPKTDTHNV